jgi:peptidylamidoglycolate lyase
MSKYLFPRKLTRRDFFATSAVAAAGLTLTTGAPCRAEAVKVGNGKATYTLDEEWGKLPRGMHYGLGCAIVVDAKDRIIVTSRSASPCVAIFGKDGKLLETWSKEFSDKVGFTPQQVAETAHGLYWSKEGDREFLYWTENVAGPKEKRIGARVYKTDMDGKILFQIGNVAEETKSSVKFDFTNPTDVAIAPNGDIYVVDGYGSQKVHRFDKDFKLLKTIGGPGKEHSKFNVCHGVWVSTLKKEPEIYIADRANNRLEVYSLELEFKRSIPDVRLPCCFYQHDGQLFVPELGARVTILDATDKIVARLGDGQGVEKEIAKHPDKFAFPHAMCVDSRGDFFIVEWVGDGRVRKFKRTPA